LYNIHHRHLLLGRTDLDFAYSYSFLRRVVCLSSVAFVHDTA